MFLDQLYLKLRAFQHRTSVLKESKISLFIFSRKGVYLLLSIIFIFIFHTLSYHPARFTYVGSEELIDVPSGYKPIIEHYNIERYGKTSIVERCSFYFESLYLNEPEWISEELEKGNHDSRIFVSREKFLEDKKKAFRKKFATMSPVQFEKFVESKGKLVEWKVEYEQERSAVKSSEAYCVDQLTNLKAFQKCYLDQHLSTSIQAKIDSKNSFKCSDNESRLFYYLTRKLPEYKRWDGTVLNDRLPELKDYKPASEKNKDDHTPIDEALKSSCFTRFLQKSYNGKGIALKLPSKRNEIEQMTGLLLTLRMLGNKLPIEIFHNGELDEALKGKIVHVSRSKKVELSDINALQKIKSLNSLGLDALKTDTEIIPLDIWFVDVSKAIKPDSKWMATEYSDKLLTYLFSSFEDTLLLDFDTVPLVNLNKHIFKSKEYKSKGAFFFKERELSEPLSQVQAKFLNKLLPTDYDQKIFGINLLTSHTLNNRFLKSGFKHWQSGGVIAVNKKKHFNAVLTTLNLNLWHSVKEAISGEKELFWLGFALVGDEQYFMNNQPAGAVGEITPFEERLPLLKTANAESARRDLKSSQICSSHVGHLSPKEYGHTLLWIDAGMRYCEWINPLSIEQDLELDFILERTKNDLRDKYTSPLTIKSMIIPPAQEIMKNSPGFEPSLGWEPTKGCNTQTWCVYDKIGGVDDPFYHGTLINFDTHEVEKFGILGEIWAKSEDLVAFD